MSQLPAGACEPDRAVHRLDRWCTEHLRRPAPPGRQPTARASQTAWFRLPSHTRRQPNSYPDAHASLDCADRTPVAKRGCR